MEAWAKVEVVGQERGMDWGLRFECVADGTC